LSYLRFTPEEFRAIRQACDPVHLNADFLAVFKYFLVEALDDTLPDLATRIRRFRRSQLVLLYGFLRQQRTAAAKSQAQTRREESECGLTAEELQAVRYASDPFFLHDGYPGSFRDFLLYNLREARPRLAAKLARLHPRQIARLYQQAKRRSRWNA
jgi:hypothetical protein